MSLSINYNCLNLIVGTEEVMNCINEILREHKNILLGLPTCLIFFPEAEMIFFLSLVFFDKIKFRCLSFS